MYSGDSNFVGSTSDVATETVVLAKSHTALTSSEKPANVGDAVTFTATVTSGNKNATVTATGSVEFLDGTTVLATVPVDANGMATLTTSSLAAGTHVITALYEGDGEYATSSGQVSSASCR